MSDEHHDDEHGGGHGKGHGGGGHGGGHGGGGHAEGEHEGAPEWLISFADNVALMMGFFVVLLAMNMKPAAASGGSSEGKEQGAASQDAQMLDWAISIRDAFNNPVNSNNPNDTVLARRMREREAEALARTPGQKGIEQEVKSIRAGNLFSNGGTVDFEHGAIEMDEKGKGQLVEILKHRKGVNRNVVLVRGHASAAEAHDLSDRGMKLSYQRALNVADALVQGGLSWNQLRIVACADNDRLVKTSYEELGHRKNQRVEVIETNDTVSDEADGDDAKQSSGARPDVPLSEGGH